MKLIQRNLIMRHWMAFTAIPLAECQGLRVNVFHSMDFFAYKGPLLIVLQSTNPSTAGVWDTTLLSMSEVTPEDIENASQENLIEEAHKRGYRVAFSTFIRNGSKELLCNEKAPKVFKFKSHEKKSDEFISSDEENEVASSEECLQAWIDRALKYWLSLESKVKAIAFIAPSDHIIQTIAWETGDAFKVSDVLEFAFELPRPEKVRNWFMEGMQKGV
ncbi:unnamed protein product [Hymenolepis diminuta]|uniref:Proteasome assembly chaperone 2 n=1 Tax=Hymenolepis diminuta TaxID=6216 RepID=A0A0R3SF47_HYMDI|nr:unnamed protein product [Hymenolepis diminuta]